MSNLKIKGEVSIFQGNVKLFTVNQVTVKGSELLLKSIIDPQIVFTNRLNGCFLLCDYRNEITPQTSIYTFINGNYLQPYSSLWKSSHTASFSSTDDSYSAELTFNFPKIDQGLTLSPYTAVALISGFNSNGYPEIPGVRVEPYVPNQYNEVFAAALLDFDVERSTIIPLVVKWKLTLFVS